MSEPFELEHWKSRALVAEKEREAARPVLVHLRGYFMAVDRMDPRSSKELELVRGYLRVHDQEWWTRAHAMNAVAEGIAGIRDDEGSPASSQEGRKTP
jgi:hypothetical protein